MFFVPFDIILKLCLPIRCIGGRCRCEFAPSMTMPKASTNFYHGFVLGKNYIGMSREILNVKPEPKTVSMKERSDEHLRFSICRPDAAHIPASVFLCQRIHVGSSLEFEIPESQDFVFLQGLHYFRLFVSHIFSLCQPEKFKCR